MENNEMTPDQILPSLMRSNMLRTVLVKHIELNKAADTKANMLLTAASIVAAVTLSSAGDTRSMGPLIVMATSILSVMFAILVVLPKPYHNHKTDDKKVLNYMYFRSFVHLSEDEYVEGFKEVMLDKNEMYDQYLRDIYRYGAVTLDKKYKMLRIGLFLFLLGLTVGAIYFILDFGSV